MSAESLRVELLALLSDVRSAGRGAFRSTLGEILDRRLPGLVATYDPFEATVLSGSFRDQLANAVSTACAQVRNGAVPPITAGWTWPQLRFRTVAWSLAAAVLILASFLLYQRWAPTEQYVVPKETPGITGPKTPVPQRPTQKPVGPAVQNRKGPEIEIRSNPVQKLREEKQFVRKEQLPVGEFSRVTGDVLVRLETGKEILARNGLTLVAGNVIDTGDFGKAVVHQKDGSIITLGFNSVAEVRERSIVLTKGSLVAKVERTADLAKFKVETPVATAEVLGTEFSLGLERVNSKLQALLQVLKGRVRFFNDHGDVVASMMTESTAQADSAPTEPKRIQRLRTYYFDVGGNPWQIDIGTSRLDLEGARRRFVYPMGWTGLTFNGLPEGPVRIVEVEHDSPALTAGLKEGDVVLAVNGKPAPPGRRPLSQSLGALVRLTVERKGERLEYSLVPRFEGPALPQLSEAVANRLYAYTSLALSGEMDRALEGLRALAGSTQAPEAFNNLAVLFEMRDEMGPTIRSYASAVRLAPSYAPYHLNLGLALQKIGNLQRSVEEMEVAVALEPTYHEAILLLARAYGLVYRHDDAIRLLDAAINRDGKCAHYWGYRNIALIKAGRFAEAVTSAERAIEIAPDFAAAYGALGRALRLSRNPKAEVAFRKAFELDPAEVGYLTDLATLYSDMRRYEEAETTLREAVRLDPGSALARNKLGLVFGRQSRMAEAEQEFREAVRLSHGTVGYVNLGITLNNLNRNQESEAAYRKAIEIDPSDMLAYYNLGVLYARAQKHLEAAEMYSRAISLDPTKVAVYFNLAAELQAANRPKEVEETFQAILRVEPKNENAHHQLGKLLMNQDRNREAAPFLRTVIELSPNHVDAYIDLGIVLLRLHRYPEADVVLRKANELEPRNPVIYANRGAVFADWGRPAEAEPMFRKADELQPGNPTWHDELAHILDKLGRLEEAVVEFRAAFQANPNDAGQGAELGWSLVKIHRWTEAVLSYQKCLELDPKGPNALNAKNNLGFALIFLGKLAEAEAVLSEALRMKADDTEAQSNWGLLLAHKGVDLDEALRLAKNAAKPDSDPQRWMVLGFVHFKRGEFDEAIEPFERSAKGWGKAYLAADALVILGQVHEAKRDISKAVDAYRRALQIESGNKPAAEALKRLGG